MNANDDRDAALVFEQKPPDATSNNIVAFSDRAFVFFERG